MTIAWGIPLCLDHYPRLIFPSMEKVGEWNYRVTIVRSGVQRMYLQNDKGIELRDSLGWVDADAVVADVGGGDGVEVAGNEVPGGEVGEGEGIGAEDVGGGFDTVLDPDF